MDSLTNRNLFHEMVTDMLETSVHAKVEGDVCSRIGAEFGEVFQRGQQGSPFNAGLYLDNETDNSTRKILGIVVKTAQYRITQEGNGMFQRLDIELNDREKECDAIILLWPALRNSSDTWTVLDTKTFNLNHLRIRNAYYGGIENSLPPHFWPFTASVSESLGKIREMYEGTRQSLTSDQ